MPDQAITIDSNAAAVSVQYRDAPKAIAKTIVKILNTIGAGVVRYIGREKLSGQVLGVRTGNTRRALYFRVFADANGLDAGVVIGADVKKAPGARVQEYGGTITAKNGALAIPLPPALTANGVARVSARVFMDNPSTLGFDAAFIRKGVIFGKHTGGGIEPVFALKQSVTLPERSYLRAGVNERRDWILQQLGTAPNPAADLGGA